MYTAKRSDIKIGMGFIHAARKYPPFYNSYNNKIKKDEKKDTRRGKLRPNSGKRVQKDSERKRDNSGDSQLASNIETIFNSSKFIKKDTHENPHYHLQIIINNKLNESKEKKERGTAKVK